MTGLSRSEYKALALHGALAKRLRDDTSLLVLAKRRITWLRARNPAGAPYYDQWDTLLDGPTDRLFKAMTSTSEEGCALRQESPFFDVVDQKERARIYREAANELDAVTRP